MSVSVKPFQPLREGLSALLAPLGFTRSARPLQLSRVREDILQTLAVVVRSEGFGDVAFLLDYAALPLFTHEEFMSLSPGGTIGESQAHPGRVAATRNHGPSSGWQATSDWLVPVVDRDRELATVFSAIEAYVDREMKPWFEQTATVAGLLSLYEQDEIISEDHRLFRRACCLARLARCDEARPVLAQALEVYCTPERQPKWLPQRVELCAALDEALARGEPEPLLEEWTAFSLEHLARELPAPPKVRGKRAPKAPPA